MPKKEFTGYEKHLMKVIAQEKKKSAQLNSALTESLSRISALERTLADQSKLLDRLLQDSGLDRATVESLIAAEEKRGVNAQVFSNILRMIGY